MRKQIKKPLLVIDCKSYVNNIIKKYGEDIKREDQKFIFYISNEGGKCDSRI